MKKIILAITGVMVLWLIYQLVIFSVYYKASIKMVNNTRANIEERFNKIGGTNND